MVLPRGMGAVDLSMIRKMVMSCGKLGLPIISISIYDKAVLEDALVHPEKHEDLVVRVWGFNARIYRSGRGAQATCDEQNAVRGGWQNGNHGFGHERTALFPA